MSRSARTSRCVQRALSNEQSIDDAVSIFNTNYDTGEIPLVLIPPHRSVFSFWLSVPTGVCCLGQRFGQDAGMATAGGSFKLPGYRISHVVTMQACNYIAPVQRCPTSDNVRVNIDLKVIFNIRNADEFVYNLGAVHFDRLLAGAIDEGIRHFVRRQTHQTVRSLRGSKATDLLDMLNNKFNNCGVTFSNCTISAVTLPKSLEDSLEHSTEMNKQMDKAEREQEYETRKIEQSSEIRLAEYTRKIDQTVTEEEGKKQRAKLSHKQQVALTEMKLKDTMSRAQEEMGVKSMQLQAVLDRAKTTMETRRVDMISVEEADAEAKRVQADNDYFRISSEADAEKERLLGAAEGIRLDAEAEAKSTQHLTHKRRHDLEMREKQVIMKIAEKADFNMIGPSGDKLINAVMMGNVDQKSDWFNSEN